MTHDLNWSDITSKDDNALLSFPDACLHILEAVADIGLVFGGFLDAFVKLIINFKPFTLLSTQ